MDLDHRNPLLVHFTHVRNLQGIAERGLIADTRGADPHVDCAEEGIKEARRRRSVPIGPGGVVADYAPFYYAPRSPMLRRIHGGGVSGYQDGQYPLVYLVSRLSKLVEHEVAWVATNLNAALRTARFVNRVDQLAAHIDWDLMLQRMWNNTPEDGSRMQRRMAEMLGHGVVPWTAVDLIVVIDEAMAGRVHAALDGIAHQPPVAVRRGWYF